MRYEKQKSKTKRETQRFKRDFRRAKAGGFTSSLKKFATEHDLGQMWLLRKAEKPVKKPKRVKIPKPKDHSKKRR